MAAFRVVVAGRYLVCIDSTDLKLTLSQHDPRGGEVTVHHKGSTVHAHRGKGI